MAIAPKKTIKDFYSPFSNPSGAFTLPPIATPAQMATAPVPPPAPTSPLNAFIAAGNQRLGVDPRLAPGQTIPAGVKPGMQPGPVVATGPTAAAPSSGPLFSGAGGGASGPTGSAIPPQYLNADGSIKTPAEIAANVGSALKSAHSNGDIGTLSAEQFATGEKSAVDLDAEATRINNTRNDIAVGEKDPYGVASKSGIAYTPAELDAIEKAYSGIYDPALDTAMAKVKQKQQEDADDKSFQNDLAKMKAQFGYDKALKETAPGAAASSASGAGGVYVPGANPTVDAWAQRIFDGTAKITDIPASDSGLRSAVTVALNASGNDLAGHPTVTALGSQARTEAQTLLSKLDNREGTAAVGGTSLFNGLAIPGSERSNFKIDFQNLKDLLSLDGVKYLKGQGAVSDAERALLASAVTKLNLAQSEDEFRSTLVGIVNQLSGTDSGDASGDATGAAPSSQPQTLVSPDGTVHTLQADGTYD